MGKYQYFWSACLALLFGAGLVDAAEYAVMQSGSRVRAERHEIMGPITRLFLPGGGLVEVDTGAIRGFETEEYTPPPPAQTKRQATPMKTADLAEIVRSSGDRHGLDPDLIHSVIRAESAGDPHAVSRKGAIGLMQLMPGTARGLAVNNVFDPSENVDAGTRYLRQLLEIYKDQENGLALALAAYNAGPEKVAAYKGIPPYPETRDYVRRVIRSFNQKKTGTAN